MKKGDLLPVTVEGVHITNAVVEAVDAEKSQVHLLIPGVRAVVGFRVSLSNEAPSEAPQKETIIDEVVRQDNSSEPPAEPSDSGTAASEAAVEAETPEAPAEAGTEAPAGPTESNSVE